MTTFAIRVSKYSQSSLNATQTSIPTTPTSHWLMLDQIDVWLIFYFDQTSQSQKKTSSDQNTKLMYMSTVYISEPYTRKCQRNERKEGNKEKNEESYIGVILYFVASFS